MKSSLKVENDAVCSNHPPSRPRQFLLVHYLSSLSKSFRAYWIFWLSWVCATENHNTLRTGCHDGKGEHLILFRAERQTTHHKSCACGNIQDLSKVYRAGYKMSLCSRRFPTSEYGIVDWKDSESDYAHLSLFLTGNTARGMIIPRRKGWGD